MIRETIPVNEVLSRAVAVGQYYGFTPLSTLAARTRGAAQVKIPELDSLSGIAFDPTAQTVASFLRQFQKTGLAPNARQPLFVWHTNIAPGRPAPKKTVVQFHAIGTDRVLADTVVIRAMLALARDLFGEEPIVRVNSMGDKETRARYTRELGVFFRKRADTLPEECTNCAKRDAVEAAELTIARACTEDLPAPTEHLSDASRKRFEELLEYLEVTETPYELARNLISRGSAWSETCFEIVVQGRRVAWGSRYGDLTRHLFSTSLPATGAVLQVASEGAARPVSTSPGRLRFSFVHIGDDAKRLSIELAEHFRKARVSLTQDIGVESLTEQLSLAERRGSPYVLIMGRKEALERSAILRNTKTQQETVLPLAGIVERLRAVAA